MKMGSAETVRKKISLSIEAAKRRKMLPQHRRIGNGFLTVEYVDALEQEMLAAAEGLEFERGCITADRVLQLRDNLGKPLSEVEFEKPKGKSAGKQRKRRKGIQSSGRVKVPRPKRG